MPDHLHARPPAANQPHPAWWPLASYACMPAACDRVLAQGTDTEPNGFTHADFVAEVQHWQRLLRQLPHTRIAIFEPHPAQFAALLWATLHAGKMAVLPSDTQAATLRALEAHGCARLGSLEGALPRPHRAGPTEVLAPLALDQAQLGLFTSGSQGQPQLIEKTLRQFEAELGTLEQTFGARLAPTNASTTPAPLAVWATVSHQHIYGLLFLVLWSMASGRLMGQTRLLYPEDMVEKLTQPAILITTPAHLRRLDESLNWQAAQGAVQAIFSSGGPLPFEAAQHAERLLGSAPIEIFGSSETGGIAWRQSHTAEQPWQVLHGVRWQAQEELLAVQSSHLPDDQWFTTSDRIAVLSAQHFQLLGRQDRIVKIEEKRISLTAIEQQLLQSAYVQEIKATVVPTSIGQRVAAVVVLSALGQEQLAQNRRALIQNLRALALEQVEAIGAPKRWRFVAALPINAQGKTPQALLQSLFETPPAQGRSDTGGSTDGDGDAGADTGAGANSALPRLTDAAAWPAQPALEWLEKTDTEALVRLDIEAQLTVFQGHFPQQPILPGVAQLDWALTLGHAAFALPPCFMGLQALKFVHPIAPGTLLFLQLKTSQKDALHTLHFHLHSFSEQGEKIDHASGRALWQKECHDAQ